MDGRPANRWDKPLTAPPPPLKKIYTHPDINKCVSFKVRGVFVNKFLSEASFVIPIVYSGFVIKSIL